MKNSQIEKDSLFQKDFKIQAVKRARNISTCDSGVWEESLVSPMDSCQRLMRCKENLFIPGSVIWRGDIFEHNLWIPCSIDRLTQMLDLRVYSVLFSVGLTTELSNSMSATSAWVLVHLSRSAVSATHDSRESRELRWPHNSLCISFTLSFLYCFFIAIH